MRPVKWSLEPVYKSQVMRCIFRRKNQPLHSLLNYYIIYTRNKNISFCQNTNMVLSSIKITIITTKKKKNHALYTLTIFRSSTLVRATKILWKFQWQKRAKLGVVGVQEHVDLNGSRKRTDTCLSRF